MRRGDDAAFGLRSTLTSSRLISTVAATAGAIAVLAGGTAYLLVSEIRPFAVPVMAAGALLVVTAAVLSRMAVAIALTGARGRRGMSTVTLTAAFLVTLALVNVLVFRHPGRLDLTYTRVFTLADQTVGLLEGLDGPVRANAFFVPGESTQLMQQVLDLLGEFQRTSKLFSYRLLDPELNAAAAHRYEVGRYPAIVFEDLETVVRHPVSAFSEQDLLTGLLIVTGERRKKVYYLSDHRERFESGSVARDDGLDAALAGMRGDNYEVASLSLAERGGVPDDAAVVVIPGPRGELSAGDSDALEAYVLRGGGILGMFDPGTPGSFLDLFVRWGVQIGRHSVADPISNVGGEVLTPLAQRSNGQFPAGPNAMTINSPLNVVFFPGVTTVEPVASTEGMSQQGPLSIVPIAVTTPGSWLETDPDRPEYDAGSESRASFPVAVAVEASGTLDGAIRHPPARFVLFGDSDFASNRYFSSLDNSDLLLNSVNWLAEDFDLISIRPRVFASRELVVNRRERDFIQWSGWLLPPSVALLLGAYVWWRRR